MSEDGNIRLKWVEFGVMTVFNVLFDIKETPFSAQVATPFFY
jgi:hypothetical protein